MSLTSEWFPGGLPRLQCQPTRLLNPARQQCSALFSVLMTWFLTNKIRLTAFSYLDSLTVSLYITWPFWVFGQISVPKNFGGRIGVPPAQCRRFERVICTRIEKTALQQCIHHNWSCCKCTDVCFSCFNFIAFQTFKSWRYRSNKMRFPYYMLCMSQLHSYLLVKCGETTKALQVSQF